MTDTVTIPKLTPMNFFSIKEPRYHDNAVLLKASKIARHNKVVFTDAPSMGTEPYYVSGETVKKCKKSSNGVIKVYVVPLDKLKRLELDEKDMRYLI